MLNYLHYMYGPDFFQHPKKYDRLPLWRIPDGTLLTYKTVAGWLTQWATDTSRNPKKFTTHSIRKGITEDATAMNIPEPWQRIGGKWRSAAIHVYQNLDPQKIANLYAVLSGEKSIRDLIELNTEDKANPRTIQKRLSATAKKWKLLNEDSSLIFSPNDGFPADMARTFLSGLVSTFLPTPPPTA